MSLGRNITVNTTVLYLIAIVVIVAAFLLLGGGPWIHGMTHGGRPVRINDWNLFPILVSLGIGIIIGVVVARRKR
jgi:hypothetical protein